MGDFVVSAVINLKGNYEQKARAYTKSTEQFVKGSNRQLKTLNNSYVKHGETISRVGRNMGLIAAGVVGTQAIKKVIDFDAQLTRMQTDGRATSEQIAVLKEQMINLANDPSIRLNKNELFEGFDAIVAATGDLKAAQDNLYNLAVFMQATGTAGRDAGNLIALSFKAGRKEIEQVGEFLATTAELSKTGSVPLRESAGVGKAVYAPAVAYMGASKETLDNSGALLQLVIDAVKSPDIAAEAMSSLMTELEDKDVQKKLASAGIKVKNEQTNKLRQLTDLIPEIYKAAKGDMGKIGSVFGQSSTKVFTAYGMEGAPQQLQALLNTKGTIGGMASDARINALTAKAGVQSIGNTASELSDWLISTTAKELAADIDALKSPGKHGGLLNVMGSIATRPFKDEKDWPERQQQNISGEIKISIDQENRAKVKKVTSNNKDVNIQVDNGIQVGTQ